MFFKKKKQLHAPGHKMLFSPPPAKHKYTLLLLYNSIFYFIVPKSPPHTQTHTIILCHHATVATVSNKKEFPQVPLLFAASSLQNSSPCTPLPPQRLRFSMLQSNSTHHQTSPGVAHSSPCPRCFNPLTLRSSSETSQVRQESHRTLTPN